MPGLVFHEDKLVYWFVPKNACTTLKIFFADRYGIEYSYIHHAPFEVTHEVIPEYFNFAIVRHPVDRLFSLYRDKISPDGRTDDVFINGVDGVVLHKFKVFHKDMTFDEFVRAVVSIDLPDDHFGLQSGQIPEGVECHKFEDSLLLKVLPKHNATSGDKWLVTEQSVRMIEEHYREDYERFGYKLLTQ